MLSNFKRYVFSKQRILLVLILVICFSSYYQITSYDFIRWDDDVQITENTYVKNLNWQNVNHNFHEERYTFITLTIFSLFYEIWGNNPVPFHWLSIILHLLNVILVFQLTKQFSKNIFTVSFVALLFALHPMRVESVAWISEIKDLLFTFFSLTAFLFYIKYLQNNLKFYFFILAASMAVLAAFSKIQGLLVPLSFYLLDILYKRRISIALILEKVLLIFFIFFIFYWTINVVSILVLVVYFIFRERKINLSQVVKISLLCFLGLVGLFYLFHFLSPDKLRLWANISDFRNTFAFVERFFLAGFALGFYLYNFIFPVSLNAVHPYPVRLIGGELPSEYYFALIVLCIVFTASVVMIIKRNKIPDLFFFGWFFFLVNISIVLHFIPIEGRLVVADRYSYLAYFGLFVSVATIGENYLFQKQKFNNTVWLIFILIISVFSVSTYYRCKVWNNTQTLFMDVLKKNPNISFAHLNLAATYLNKNKPDSALIYFNTSITLDSLDPTAYFNRAFAFIKKSDSKNALNDFNTVLRLSKNNKYKALVYTNIGEIYRKRGMDSLAVNYYNLAIENDSLLAVSYNNRGMYFLDKNRLKEAKSDFLKAVSLNSDYAEALNNMGWVLTLEGHYEEAQKCFDRSIEIYPEYSFAYDNRGYLKYVMRDNAGALEDLNKAIILNPSLSQAYINRGRTYASMKNFKSAIIDFSFVLKYEPQNMAALINRAYAWLYMNEIKKAENDFILNTEYYPQNAIVWQNLALFYYTIKDYTKAEKYFNLSLDLHPNNPESFFWMGELNRKKGNEEASCRYYKKAYNLGLAKAKNALDQYCKD